MRTKMKGVVLSTTGYNDKYSIVRLFTESFGYASYLIPKSSARRSRLKTSMFFPLSTLFVDVEHFPLRDIHRITDANIVQSSSQASTDEVKLSILFFLSDFLSKLLREEDENRTLFKFLEQSVSHFLKSENGMANFHLWMLVKATSFFGITPDMSNFREGTYFDLHEGVFVSESFFSKDRLLGSSESISLYQLYHADLEEIDAIKMNRSERLNLLEGLLDYYKLHHVNIRNVNVRKILSDLFF